MRKILTVLSAFVVISCSSGNGVSTTKLNYLEVDNFFSSKTDIDRKGSQYSLLLKKEVPFTSEEILRTEKHYKAIKRAMAEVNPATAGYYEQITDREQLESKKIFSGKRFTVNYIKIVEKGEYPTVLLNERVEIVKSDGGVLYPKYPKTFYTVKFDCGNPHNDSIKNMYAKSIIPEKGNAEVIFELLNPIRVTGGEKIKLRYYFSNNTVTDEEMYYSRETAESSMYIFDKAKQVACAG